MAKRRVIYDLDFKPEVLRRMQDEVLSCRQVAVFFNIRRLDLVAEWSRLYTAHGTAALQPGWKWEQTRMSKPPSRREDHEAVTNDQRSREELLRDLQQLRAENGYLKNAGLGSNQVALGTRERALIVLELRSHIPFADLLHAAELARSSFYY